MYIQEKIYKEILNSNTNNDIVNIIENYINGNDYFDKSLHSLLLKEGINSKHLESILNEALLNEGIFSDKMQRTIGTYCLMVTLMSLNPTAGYSTPTVHQALDTAVGVEMPSAPGTKDLWVDSNGNELSPKEIADKLQNNPDLSVFELTPNNAPKKVTAGTSTLDFETGEITYGEPPADTSAPATYDAETGEVSQDETFDLSGKKVYTIVNADGSETYVSGPLGGEPVKTFDIPEEFSSQMSKQIRQIMLEFQNDAVEGELPDFSAENESFQKIMDRAFNLEKMFDAVKGNMFMYSMLVTLMMNSSEGVAKGRSATTSKIYKKSAQERIQMFAHYVAGISEEVKFRSTDKLDSYFSENPPDAKTAKLWNVFKNIEAQLEVTAKEAWGSYNGTIWMWAPRGASASDFADEVNPEQITKDKEHFCGGTQNYLLSVLKDHYGDELEIPDRAFNSTTKWHSSPEVQKTLVFDYKAFIGVPEATTASLMSEILRPGQIAIVKTSATFESREEGGHFGFVVKVVPPAKGMKKLLKLTKKQKERAAGGVWLYEGNTADRRAPGKETGFKLVFRPFTKIASAAAISPIFSKSARKGLVDLMRKTKELREQWTKNALKKWMEVKTKRHAERAAKRAAKRAADIQQAKKSAARRVKKKLKASRRSG